MSVSKALKKIAFWSNRANDAYSMGEADWVHPPPTNASFLAKVVSDHYDGSEESLKRALEAVETICRGIDPKRHRWRPAP